MMLEELFKVIHENNSGEISFGEFKNWFCPSHAADNAQIADALHTSRVTVGMWRQRFVDLSIECLEEAP